MPAVDTAANLFELAVGLAGPLTFDPFVCKVDAREWE